jgi:hypothetical protein
MRTKVGKVLIAKDIARTSTVQINDPSTSGTYIAEGEVVILDKNKNVLSAGDTIDDSASIYIVEGLADTFSYANEAGTAITGARRLLFSDEIKGADVVEYSGRSYAAAVEQAWTLSGSMTVVSGEEYVLRIVYKDYHGDPRQFTYTYRVVASSTSQTTLYTDLAAAINSHPERRINAVATSGPDVLTITAKAYDDNETVDSINNYEQVIFEVFPYSNNFTGVTIAQSVAPNKGVGTWKLVRDEEKWSQGYEGFGQRTYFPVVLPTFRTVKSETYDTIIIRSKNSYVPSYSDIRNVDITTKLFIPVPATTNQGTAILAALNPWMASTPRAFANVSV